MNTNEPCPGCETPGQPHDEECRAAAAAAQVRNAAVHPVMREIVNAASPGVPPEFETWGVPADKRQPPLSEETQRRIAEGLRKYCPLDPIPDAPTPWTAKLFHGSTRHEITAANGRIILIADILPEHANRITDAVNRATPTRLEHYQRQAERSAIDEGNSEPDVLDIAADWLEDYTADMSYTRREEVMAQRDLMIAAFCAGSTRSQKPATLYIQQVGSAIRPTREIRAALSGTNLEGQPVSETLVLKPGDGEVVSKNQYSTLQIGEPVREYRIGWIAGNAEENAKQYCDGLFTEEEAKTQVEAMRKSEELPGLRGAKFDSQYFYEKVEASDQ